MSTLAASPSPLQKLAQWARGYSLLELTRGLLALNLAKFGYDLLVLSPWFGRWDDGFTPTTDALADPYALPAWALRLFLPFWHLPGWLPPALLLVTALAMLVALVRRSPVESYLAVFAAYLGYGLKCRHVLLASQGDLWLVFSVLFLGLARGRPSIWNGVWRLQCFAVYFFAGVNKWFLPAWHNGDAVHNSLFSPFVAYARAESLAHLPQAVYLALAWLTMGQRLLCAWGLLLPDEEGRPLPGVLRKLCVAGFFLMHTGYWLLLDVGTFSTVGWACAPGLFEDPARQLGEWQGWATLRRHWAAGLVGCAVLLSSPLHFIKAAEPLYEAAPRWDMFVGSSPNHPLVKYELWYGDDPQSYQPLLKFLGLDWRTQLREDQFTWNSYLWNWRLRFWIYNVTDRDDSDLAVQRFRETLAKEFAPPGLASRPAREELKRVDMSVARLY